MDLETCSIDYCCINSRFLYLENESFLRIDLIKALFQNFFYFSGLTMLLVLNTCPFSSKALTLSFTRHFGRSRRGVRLEVYMR